MIESRDDLDLISDQSTRVRLGRHDRLEGGDRGQPNEPDIICQAGTSKLRAWGRTLPPERLPSSELHPSEFVRYREVWRLTTEPF